MFKSQGGDTRVEVVYPGEYIVIITRRTVVGAEAGIFVTQWSKP